MGDERDHLLRAATNRIEAINETVMYYSFDEGEEATELEGIAGKGDSGGPAFIDEDGKISLLGIGSFGLFPEGTAGRYYTMDAYVRISQYYQWIEQTIESDGPTAEEWSKPVRFKSNWPNTPVGKVANQFFDAYLKSNIQNLQEFYIKYENLSEADASEKAQRVFNSLNSQIPYNKFEIIGFSTDGKNKIRVLIKIDKEEDEYRSLGINLNENHNLSRLYMLWEQPPPEEIWQ